MSKRMEKMESIMMKRRKMKKKTKKTMTMSTAVERMNTTMKRRRKSQKMFHQRLLLQLKTLKGLKKLRFPKKWKSCNLRSRKRKKSHSYL